MLGAVKKGLDFSDVDLNNLPKGGLDKDTAASAAMDLLPAGAAVGVIKKVGGEGLEWAGKKISTALGDITATPSAKVPGKIQLTHWDGKAGSSNTVKDEVFDTVEEAEKALEKYSETKPKK